MSEKSREGLKGFLEESGLCVQIVQGFLKLIIKAGPVKQNLMRLRENNLVATLTTFSDPGEIFHFCQFHPEMEAVQPP